MNCDEEQFKWLQDKSTEEMQDIQTLIKKFLETLGMPAPSEDVKSKKTKAKTSTYEVKKWDLVTQQMLVQIGIRNALDTLLSIGIPMEHLQIIFKENFLKRIYALETLSYVIHDMESSDSEKESELTSKAFDLVLRTKLGIFKTFKKETDIEYYDFLDDQSVVSDNMLDFFQCLSIIESEEQIEAMCEELDATMMDNQVKPLKFLN